MAFVEWTMKGIEYANCNCNVGCPCQFNALPTHGNCRALTFVQIDTGKFADVTLDGLRWGIMGSWPGPIHQGNGTFQTIIEERASGAQRAALEAISQGREIDAGTLIWQVFSTTVSRVLPTLFRPIDLSIDLDKGTAAVHIPGLIDGASRPIANPVTGARHRAVVRLPTGFEFTEAEFTRGSVRSEGPIDLQFVDTHAHLAKIHWSTHGVVR
jgi:hypothetical protein